MKRSIAILAILIASANLADAADDIIPEGKPVAWRLTDGATIRFFWLQHSPPGKDTVKYFEIVPANSVAASLDHPSVRRVFPFAITHAGYLNVELRATPNEKIVWLVDVSRPGQKIGCSLDRFSDTFVDEGGKHPEAVSTDGGKVIAPIEDPR